MAIANASDEDWRLLTTFFPPRWKELGQATGALKGLRQDKNEENYMRTLLLHLGCGLSLRETVVRARQARLAELSDVAVLKRLRKSKEGSIGFVALCWKSAGLLLARRTRQRCD